MDLFRRTKCVGHDINQETRLGGYKVHRQIGKTEITEEYSHGSRTGMRFTHAGRHRAAGKCGQLS